MATLHAATQAPPLFPYSKWNSRLTDLAAEYQQNLPYPHLLLSDFVNPDAALAAANEFPPTSSEAWTQYKHQNENKLGMAKRALFPSVLGQIADELNTPRFVKWLSALTGITDLIADDLLEGGGLHQSTRGGFLNVHTDFSHHHYHKHWCRRVNLILYLNPAWDENWGGAIELWDEKMQNYIAKYPLLLNHALIFNTDARSFHGFPEPLRCPESESRKSLAFYYYTLDKNAHSAGKSTNYRARPQDSLAKSALIWLDKQAVDIYSRAKAHFGFSDEFASRILGLISRKK